VIVYDGQPDGLTEDVLDRIYRFEKFAAPAHDPAEQGEGARQPNLGMPNPANAATA
jgi:hypothetical protein